MLKLLAIILLVGILIYFWKLALLFLAVAIVLLILVEVLRAPDVKDVDTSSPESRQVLPDSELGTPTGKEAEASTSQEPRAPRRSKSPSQERQTSGPQPHVEPQPIELPDESITPSESKSETLEENVPAAPLQDVQVTPLQDALNTLTARRIELKPEPIPYPMGGKNARAVLSKSEWKAVREIVLEEHGWKCALCGYARNTANLHCHEVWQYPWEIRSFGKKSKNVPVMRLVGLQILCRFCHGAKHVGCPSNKEILPLIKEHLRRVYGMTEEELDQVESNAVAAVTPNETKIPRELDLTYLNQERFAQVREMMGGRVFSTNELANCRAKPVYS
jgi:hypothetical protein